MTKLSAIAQATACKRWLRRIYEVRMGGEGEANSAGVCGWKDSVHKRRRQELRRYGEGGEERVRGGGRSSEGMGREERRGEGKRRRQELRRYGEERRGEERVRGGGRSSEGMGRRREGRAARKPRTTMLYNNML
eukprot:766151-Hanusia_phi.AAC.2